MSSRAGKPQTSTFETSGMRGYALLGCATVMMGFGGFLAWAATAPLDSAAIARGEIEVESANKPIQHLEGGLVAAIFVKEAQAVKKGAALFKVQSSATIAQRDSLRVQLDAAMGKFARLVAEQGERETIRFPATLVERKDQPHVAKVIADQRQQFLDRKIASAERISILKSRLDEATALHGGKMARARALKSELASLEAQMARVRPILKEGWFPRNKFEELVRRGDKLGGDLKFTEADVSRQSGSIAGLKLQIKHARQAKLEKISSELAETNTRIADLSARLEALEERMHRGRRQGAAGWYHPEHQGARRGRSRATGLHSGRNRPGRRQTRRRRQGLAERHRFDPDPGGRRIFASPPSRQAGRRRSRGAS